MYHAALVALFAYATLPPGVNLECRAWDYASGKVRIGGRNQELRQMLPIPCEIQPRHGDEAGLYIAPLPVGHATLYSVRACFSGNGNCSDWVSGE